MVLDLDGIYPCHCCQSSKGSLCIAGCMWWYYCNLVWICMAILLQQSHEPQGLGTTCITPMLYTNTCRIYAHITVPTPTHAEYMLISKSKPQYIKRCKYLSFVTTSSRSHYLLFLFLSCDVTSHSHHLVLKSEHSLDVYIVKDDT